MDNENKNENFSRDADQTRYIYLVGLIALTALVGLFTLEILAMFRFGKSTDGYKPFIFTPEIVHTIIPVTVGTIGVVGGFLFGRAVGQQKVNGGQK